MLDVKEIDSFYGERQVLRGMSLHVNEGEVVAILGRNGMGKTTTIHTVMGIVRARQGRILIDGEDVAQLAPYQISRRGAGLVPQGRRIFPSLSVRENLLVGSSGSGRGKGWNLDRVYELFPVLRDRARAPGTVLSGGEQQMLAIARALMSNPRLLLMDEPSEGLAPAVIEQVGTVIQQLSSESLTILLVEQNLSLALKVATRVYVLEKGRVVHEAHTDRFAADEDAQARYLAAMGEDPMRTAIPASHEEAMSGPGRQPS